MSLDINSFTTLIPIIFAIIVAFVYFFGRIIGDKQPINYDKHMFYFKGGDFVFACILFPYLVIHFIIASFGFYENLNSFKFKGLILGLLIILMILQSIFLGYVGSKASGTNETNPHITFFGKKYRIAISIIISFMIAGLNYSVLYISYHIISNYPNLELFVAITVVVSLSAAFLTYAILAEIHGYSSAEYPYARIMLRNGQLFSGNITSFGEYITLATEDKIYDINKNDICYVEKSKDNLNEASLEESNEQKDQCKLITE